MFFCLAMVLLLKENEGAQEKELEGSRHHVGMVLFLFAGALGPGWFAIAVRWDPRSQGPTLLSELERACKLGLSVPFL